MYFKHVAYAHSETYTRQHGSPLEATNTHISASPLQESHSRGSSSDNSFRASSPMSFCDLLDVPEKPDITQSAREISKPDVSGLQKGLVGSIAPAEPAVDIATSTCSAVDDTVGTSQQRGPPRQRSPSLDARVPSNTASAWFIVSPQSSTRSHSVERHPLSPERRPAEDSHLARAVSHQPTGDTVLSESNSPGAPRPVSVHNVNVAATEKISTQRVDRSRTSSFKPIHSSREGAQNSPILHV
ncbi:uncharacterized protein PHACADRAFT_207738 [Phanerochaete carnosa HHB-10118-sp]|uniref:Uncharacterized protein n=1 Tax=Phanerochaete carnosa (strain HHB-10118-sp) TaxID=650164 RepID=K5V1X9_PHACS|nr:uncharacterized protein PHACADRAFT_207738 [Phanerochaete carnosa HHB-10118-sp]EKM56516.1 hypothetical protein PHACADRAFT_207738 [Phanerochaete carnosa HHB-10118-sp]